MLFADFSPAVRVLVFIRSYLYEIERQFAAESCAPSVDQQRKGIGITCVTHIGFTLIPDDSGECKVDDRMDHGIVHRSDRVFVWAFALAVFGPHVFEYRFFGHVRCRYPCFDGRAAPRGVDQSYRLIESFCERFPEEIAYGTEPTGTLGIAHLPFSFAIFLIPRGTVAGDGKEPD